MPAPQHWTNVLNYVKNGPLLRRLQLLRFAPDWQDVLYDRNVLFFWDETCLNDRLTELQSATGQPWLGKESHGRKVFRSAGYYIDARDPVSLRHGAGYIYPTTLQVQGAAFARGAVLADVLDEIETAIFGEVVPYLRRLGRTDLAFDIWIREGEANEPTALEVARSIHRWGAASTALDRDWKTHVRSPGIDCKIVGGHLVETFYLGSRSVAMLRAYRKDIEFEGNTAAHLLDEWAAKGWDRTGVVLRLEFELKREYMRTHSLPDGRPLTALDWTQWQEAHNAILTTMVASMVHAPDYDHEHSNRAVSSQLWQVLQAYAAFSRPSKPLRRYYAEPDELNTARDLERAIWRAQEVLGDAECARLFAGARDPTNGRVAQRRENWEDGYLWLGHHERKEEHERRTRKAAENGGQYELEFGRRASEGPRGRARGRAQAPGRGARAETKGENRKGPRGR